MKWKLWIIVAAGMLFSGCVSSSGDVVAPETSSSSSSDETPSSPSVSYVTLPTVADADAVHSLYASWKQLYFRTYEEDVALGEDDANLFSEAAQGSGRIRFDKGTGCEPEGICTVSEGIGYGMVIAYFQNDEDVLRRLWKYSRAFRIAGGFYIMDWKIRSFREAIGFNSATDADLDIATALILGYYRWGDPEMLSDALLIAKDIWDYEVNPTTLLLKPGNTSTWDVDVGSHNPSYFSPVALRLFAAHDPDHNWQGVLDANYAWLEQISAKGQLVPDWTDAAGSPKRPPNGAGSGTFRFYYLESVRVPWRLAWDYAWYGDDRAKTILTRMADQIISWTGGDPNDIRDRYPYEGIPMSETRTLDKTMGQKASLCATGMVDPAYMNWLNSCTPIVNDNPITSFNYFHHILQVMYAQLLNGLYVNPF